MHKNNDIVVEANSDLHWSLLETFIPKKTLQNVLRVAVLVSDWLNDDFRVFPTWLTLCKHILKVTSLQLYLALYQWWVSMIYTISFIHVGSHLTWAWSRYCKQQFSESALILYL